ncbi:thiamine pyrophosphate-binding protein [Pseudooceanicola nanhaiensis]|uniref:thiamine pyrophosphate-binding protein n=1 Tax=Pseudooceanicola nanhaiensis TaxID=375761 RepID=UPI001CD3A20C|nr:thiamine pyrophosphate-binding protein [Pseudooceanicola nanhaiensis]MCA0918894.1 thiamine pyrophosphate-binding protein [Pseudooceanicola nanhaiensis]
MKDETATGLGARSGARVLVDQLIAQGVARTTCVPGESYLSVLDALLDSGIDVMTCRQEGGAAMMAEAYGKMTGRPGICFVTRGPGATNASAGVHVAMQDSTPLILFVGQVAREMKEREAFQELDYKAVFGTMTKWTVEIDDAARIPEIVARAFRTAMQGRPGPVVIALPEDMLDDMVSVPDAPRVEAPQIAPVAQDIARLEELLQQAQRPIVILGGGGWSPEARESMINFAERWALPVAVSFRRTGLFPADHDLYAGDLSLGPNPALTEAIRNSDLVLMLGTRLSEIASNGYTLFDIPTPGQQIVHVHADPEELGRVYQPTLGLTATPMGLMLALEGLTPSALPSGDWAAACRKGYRIWSEAPQPNPGPLQMGEIICWLRDRLSARDYITNGAGNFATWINRYYRFRGYQTLLAPTCGSMGYGLPAGIMAKRTYPERIAVTVAGDGDFMMTGQEFATAVHHGIPVVVVLVDNGMYGTIRAHQEREFPARVSATDLTNPDFAALAVAYGGYGERVERTADFAAAFERAVESGKPAILHCLLEKEAISASRTLTGIRDRTFP